jgi:hypothetical protein
MIVVWLTPSPDPVTLRV